MFSINLRLRSNHFETQVSARSPKIRDVDPDKYLDRRTLENTKCFKRGNANGLMAEDSELDISQNIFPRKIL